MKVNMSGTSPQGGGVAAKCKDEAWKCKRCEFLLGFGMDIQGETHLRVKIGDEFVYILEPKQVARNCKRCGFINELHRVDTNSEEPAEVTDAGSQPHGGSQV